MQRSSPSCAEKRNETETESLTHSHICRLCRTFFRHFRCCCTRLGESCVAYFSAAFRLGIQMQVITSEDVQGWLGGASEEVEVGWHLQMKRDCSNFGLPGIPYVVSLFSLKYLCKKWAAKRAHTMTYLHAHTHTHRPAIYECIEEQCAASDLLLMLPYGPCLFLTKICWVGSILWLHLPASSCLPVVVVVCRPVFAQGLYPSWPIAAGFLAWFVPFCFGLLRPLAYYHLFIYLCLELQWQYFISISVCRDARMPGHSDFVCANHRGSKVRAIWPPSLAPLISPARIYRNIQLVLTARCGVYWIVMEIYG